MKSVNRVKDGLMSEFMHLILSRSEVIDKPGFVITRVTGDPSKFFFRDLFLPENLFVNLEKIVIEKFKRKGVYALYSAGKKFGYRYAMMSRQKTLADSSTKEVDHQIYLFVRYVEIVYARSIEHKSNPESKYYEAEMEDYVICRKNGLGHILTEGAQAGMVAYVLNDPFIEGVQVKCQGRGDKKCRIICTLPRFFENLGIAYTSETNLHGLGEDELVHFELNEIRKCRYARYSLKELIDSGFFTYSNGELMYRGDRYFGCEASVIYLLEDELRKIGAEDILFDVSFNYGKKVAMEVHDDYRTYITDYMSALGWGDVYMLGKTRSGCDYFPYTNYSKNSDFVLFKSLISGLLSGLLDKDIKLKHVDQNTLSGHLQVILSENGKK